MSLIFIDQMQVYWSSKYMSSHICGNSCINQDHSQLDFSFVSELVKA